MTGKKSASVSIGQITRTKIAELKAYYLTLGYNEPSRDTIIASAISLLHDKMKKEVENKKAV